MGRYEFDSSRTRSRAVSPARGLTVPPSCSSILRAALQFLRRSNPELSVGLAEVQHCMLSACDTLRADHVPSTLTPQACLVTAASTDATRRETGGPATMSSPMHQSSSRGL